MNKKQITGIAIAVCVAGAFTLATPVMATAKSHHHNVKCWGVNACKGKSSCKTKASSCKGHNSCKGKGFVKVSKKACSQLGGKLKQS